MVPHSQLFHSWGKSMLEFRMWQYPYSQTPKLLLDRATRSLIFNKAFSMWNSCSSLICCSIHIPKLPNCFLIMQVEAWSWYSACVKFIGYYKVSAWRILRKSQIQTVLDHEHQWYVHSSLQPALIMLHIAPTLLDFSCLRHLSSMLTVQLHYTRERGDIF